MAQRPKRRADNGGQARGYPRRLRVVGRLAAPVAGPTTVSRSGYLCIVTPRTVIRFCRCEGDVSGAGAVLVAVPGGSVVDALSAVTAIKSRTVIDATNLVGPRRWTALPPTPSTSSRDRRQGGQTSASRAVVPESALMVAAWRWYERAVGTSVRRAGGPQVCAGEGPGPGGSGKPSEPGSGVRVGIYVRDLKLWIHPAFPVPF